ncbi:MAG: hypothetical protein HKN23_14505 [Verrucomicrobiales bacterium]|nr:hypothetical protein [Verrucomicrobiales bacterium]
MKLNQTPIFLLAAVAVVFPLTQSPAQDKGKGGAKAPAPAKALSPKQQIVGFYAKCKDGRSAEALKEILMGNPDVQELNANQVATAFGQLVSQMGGFIDFDIARETEVSKRTIVIRCVAHFEKQPFVNEFTFYDPGSDDWRVIHVRYDKNMATMFSEDLRAAVSAGE